MLDSYSQNTGREKRLVDPILLCSIGELKLGIKASAVKRVLRAAALQGIPGAPSDLVGMLNFHNTAVPVVDLSYLLNQEPLGVDPGKLYVIIETDSVNYTQVGLLVSDCYDVVDAPQWREGLSATESTPRGAAVQLGLLNGEMVFRLSEPDLLSAEAETACLGTNSKSPIS